jgi:hypothetical protein
MPSALPQRPADIALQAREVTGRGNAKNVNELAEDKVSLPVWEHGAGQDEISVIVDCFHLLAAKISGMPKPTNPRGSMTRARLDVHGS